MIIYGILGSCELSQCAENSTGSNRGWGEEENQEEEKEEDKEEGDGFSLTSDLCVMPHWSALW